MPVLGVDLRLFISSLAFYMLKFSILESVLVPFSFLESYIPCIFKPFGAKRCNNEFVLSVTLLLTSDKN